MKSQKVQVLEETIQQIPVSKLDVIISEENYTIIDVRDKKTIEAQGSIPRAINIPFDTVETELDNRYEDSKSVFNGEGPYLFCCVGGGMSFKAATKAQEQGIKNVCNLDGGHSSWLKLKEAQAA